MQASEPLVALMDANDQIVWANTAFAQAFLPSLVLPLDFEALLRAGFAGGFGVHINSGDIDQFLHYAMPLRRSHRYRAFPVDLVDGRWLWVTETVQPDGHMLLVATDITGLKRHERLLEQAHRTALAASLTDELTGASNRRHILSLCREAIALRTPEQGAALPNLYLVLVDLDHFKAINDHHGHDGGDAVLRHFVAHMQTQLRPSDHLGRIGGEEFMLLLHASSLAVAGKVVDRLRTALRPAGDIPYNFSAGVAPVLAGAVLEDVMARADAALYQAKGEGRGRTVVVPDSGGDEWRGLNGAG